MTTILAFIAAHMGFLWREAKFRITGSEVSTSSAGGALLVVESEVLRLRFTCDRRQLLLDVQPVTTPKADEWFSVDLIRRLFLGVKEVSGLLDQSYADFLRVNIDDLEDRFSGAALPATLNELRCLARVRAKEMFG